MLSNHLTKRKIQLHSSQIKFDSIRLTLEVIKVSKPSKVYLNRQSISLLSSLGVRNYAFQDLLSEAMPHYKKYELTKKKLSYDLVSDFYSDGRMKDFQSIINQGFLELNDPFINNLLSAYLNKQLLSIREECKLYVKYGAKVFAIIDELSTLGENEVFIQIVGPSGFASDRQVVEGPCLVYRDHSCFPGDARIVYAVDEPKLRHLTNVLVYSSYDTRDLPNLCSHDDSDQDSFNVIWDKKLIPPKANMPARNYTTSVTPKDLNKIAFKEIAKYFTTYISKDRLDFLRKAYIATADRHKEGTLHSDCIYLSQQLSRALGKYTILRN
jgi:hypothetical protein